MGDFSTQFAAVRDEVRLAGFLEQFRRRIRIGQVFVPPVGRLLAADGKLAEPLGRGEAVGLGFVDGLVEAADFLAGLDADEDQGDDEHQPDHEGESRRQQDVVLAGGPAAGGSLVEGPDGDGEDRGPDQGRQVAIQGPQAKQGQQ